MQRREFVLTAAAVGTAVGTGEIIDTHTHFYDPTRPQGVPWPPKEEAWLYRRVLPADYQRLARPLGVAGTVVVEASAWLEDNQWVLDLAREEPFLLGLVGHLEPGRPEFRRHLERFRKNALFLGIRVGVPELRPPYTEDFDRLSDAGLELDVMIPASSYADLTRFADRFPKLRIVLNHLPLAPAGDAAALRELGQRPLVFAKVSGDLRAAPRGVLDEIWEIFGEDRVIYGSNWPVSDRYATYAEVQKAAAAFVAGKGARAAEKYFRENSRRAYRWRERA